MTFIERITDPGKPVVVDSVQEAVQVQAENERRAPQPDSEV